MQHSRLVELLHYDPATGWFTWRVSPHPRFKAGSRAGSEQKPWAKGRSQLWRSLKIDGQTHQESRLVWLYMTGAWPEHEIDHRDGNRLNNAWDNLRPATAVQNCANRGKRSDNTLGFKGIVRRGSKFRAYATLDGTRKYLGTFPTAEAASIAYRQAVTATHGEYARW